MYRPLSLCILLLSAILARGQCTESEVRRLVMSFERALTERSLVKVGSLVSPDIVVFENGHRNNGWEDFRDNHLKPEFEEPALQIKSEIVKVETTENMAWAYSRGAFSVKTARGENRSYELWSVYIFAGKESRCKIAVLDWSIRAVDEPKARVREGTAAPKTSSKQ